MKAMRNTVSLAALALVLAACASIGQIDDHGRAYREAQDAPIDSNVEDVLAEPSISILNERIPTRGGEETVRAESAEPRSACDAERWQSLIGRDEAGFADENLPDARRVIRHGSLVTQDFVPERLNIYLGPDGRVFRVTCG